MLKALRVVLVALLFCTWGGAAYGFTAYDIVSAARTGSASGTKEWENIYRHNFFRVDISANHDGSNIATVDTAKFQAKVQTDYLKIITDAASTSASGLDCTWQETSFTHCAPKNPAPGVFYFHDGNNFGELECETANCPTTSRYAAYGAADGNFAGGGGKDSLQTAYSFFFQQYIDLGQGFKGTTALWADPVTRTSYGADKVAGFDVLWNAFLQSATNKVFNTLTPSIASLINNYGFSISGTYTDTGLGYPASAPAPGPGTTPAPLTCDTGSAAYTCAPKDSDTTCTVLDIPCNLKYLFIPKPDHVTNIMKGVTFTQNLNWPIHIQDQWDFTVAFIGYFPGGAYGQNYNFGNNAMMEPHTFTIDFAGYRIPEGAKPLLSVMTWLAVLIWCINFIGIPNPFGSGTGGAGGAIRSGTNATRASVTKLNDSNGRKS